MKAQKDMMVRGGWVMLLAIALLIGTLVITQSALMLSLSNAQRLSFILSGSGILSSLLAYGVYKSGVLRWLPSLFWTLSLAIVFTVVIILVMLWGVSQVVFLSSVYFAMIASVLAFAGTSAMAFGYFIAKGTTERLTSLEEGTREITNGNLETRLDVHGADEIARLTHYFNAMAQTLEAVDKAQKELESGRKNLIAWVSHDLRTPLTNMRAMLEAISDGVIGDEETRMKYIHTSLNEIEQLNHLIEDLFELTKAEIGLKLVYETVDIEDVITPIVDALSIKAQQKGITVTQINMLQQRVTLAPDKMARVVKNLLENAIQYSPDGAEVRLSYARERQGVCIDILNTGIHLGEAQRLEVFKPFYRGEHSRRNNEGERGSGLGLAIAQRFVEAHGGTIEARANPQGTLFHIYLPNRHDNTT